MMRASKLRPHADQQGLGALVSAGLRDLPRGTSCMQHATARHQHHTRTGITMETVQQDQPAAVFEAAGWLPS